ncbi:hypothetical protein JW710_03055 [Candidatus Dojkabacteria bacterium]|nr:hypothetical protein [Candidatus Dojkabacteria bacterium]
MDYIVIKLGGSLISSEEKVVDYNLVKGYTEEIRGFFEERNKDNKRVILVVGGGNASREYRETALNCGEDSDVDQHRIGITATWLNAELFRSLLDDLAYKRVLGVGVYAENRKEGEERIGKDFKDWLSGNGQLLISGGFVNGASTDFNAVLLASKIGLDEIYKLTNIDFVYSEDPAKSKVSKPIKDISWKDYLQLFGQSIDDVTHIPSAHIPIDTLAARLADENDVTCHLMDGRDPTVIRDVFAGKDVVGTLLHP